MSWAEAEFRRVEGVLDALLANDGAPLAAAGLRSADWSARTYHYKNHHLCWFHTFTKDWIVDAETARVTVRLYFGEPDRPQEPTIEVTWRAELFRQGQESSIDERGEATCALSTFEQEGVAAIVAAALAEGVARLPGRAA